MSDVFNSQNPTTGSSMSQIPIMKYFEDSKLLEKGKNAITNWRKGEKPLARIVQLAIIALIGWGLISIAPILLSTLSALAASVIIVGAGLFLWGIRKPLSKMFRNFVRGFHKAVIKWSPFLELEDQLQKMFGSLDSFRANKAKIKQLRNEFEQTSIEMEDKSKKATELFSRKKSLAEALDKKIQDALAKNPKFKEASADLYTQWLTERNNAVAAANRASMESQAYMSWKTKYAARASVFGKLDRRLIMGENLMENKIQDFQASIELLKKEWQMAQSANRATSALRSIFGQKGENWELEYALETVISKINGDIAMTAQNLEYLDRNTEGFNFDSDEAYKKLDEIAEKLAKEEASAIPASQIASEFHELTPEEKAAAGPVGDIFK